ncbi:MAG: class I SAM-dependent methyltransferase [Kiloniellales bacterium]
MAIASEVDPDEGGTVVELGGGTGSVTACLLECGTDPDDLVVIEREPRLAELLAARFPEVDVLRGDALKLRALLSRRDVVQVKAVVCGLPLLLLSPEKQKGLLEQAFALMTPGGPFVQVTYGFGPPVVAAVAKELGLVGMRRRWVFDNVPPAAVWTYRLADAHSR